MLKEKVCIVTGAASGIGLAIAEMFAQEQCKVVMVDINEEQLKAHCERLNATYVVADLSKRADCKNVVDQTVLRHNTVDVLVNVAGIQIGRAHV